MARLAIQGWDPVDVIEAPERIQEMILDGHDDDFLLLHAARESKTTGDARQVYVRPQAILLMEES